MNTKKIESVIYWCAMKLIPSKWAKTSKLEDEQSMGYMQMRKPNIKI